MLRPVAMTWGRGGAGGRAAGTPPPRHPASTITAAGMALSALTTRR